MNMFQLAMYIRSYVEEYPYFAVITYSLCCYYSGCIHINVVMYIHILAAYLDAVQDLQTENCLKTSSDERNSPNSSMLDKYYPSH